MFFRVDSSKLPSPTECLLRNGHYAINLALMHFKVSTIMEAVKEGFKILFLFDENMFGLCTIQDDVKNHGSRKGVKNYLGMRHFVVKFRIT